MLPVSSVFHAIVTWDWSQIFYLNKDTCSILLDINVFTPKHRRTLFSFKPLGTNEISCHFIGPRDDLSYSHLLVWLQEEETWDNVINEMSFLKQCFASMKWHLLGIKHLTSVLVQSQKKTVFAKFCSKFFTFLCVLSFIAKNAENDYFDQRLACAAPKHWSKYTILFSSKKKYLDCSTNLSWQSG